MRSLLSAILLLPLPLVAGDLPHESGQPTPRIAIIIDDIGDREPEGRQAVNLPGPVAVAFLPHTPYAATLAREAHRQHKTVMLHLPLQATDARPLGPGGIELETTEGQFRRILARNLAAIPYVQGVNNHMGSLLTRHPGHMTWLMQSLRERDDDLFFVDSYTHRDSVAFQLARENGLRSARRDVFLDHRADPESIRHEFERLVALAKREGSAVGIGHPYPETMAFLAEVLPQVEEDYGVELVPITGLLAQSADRRAGSSASSSTSSSASSSASAVMVPGAN